MLGLRTLSLFGTVAERGGFRFEQKPPMVITMGLCFFEQSTSPFIPPMPFYDTTINSDVQYFIPFVKAIE